MPASYPMPQSIQPSDHTSPFWLDRPFLLAIVAGPIAWAVAGQASGRPAFDLSAHLLDPWPLVLAVLIYPPLEEIVFRGGVQQWLLARQPSDCLISRANLSTSILFALAHLWQHNVAHALLVFWPSLVFGHLYERYRSLAAPIAVHSWYNLGYGLLVAG